MFFYLYVLPKKAIRKGGLRKHQKEIEWEQQKHFRRYVNGEKQAYCKNNISCDSSDCIQEDIVYIKASDSRKQLYNLHRQTQSHAVEQCFKKSSCSAGHWDKKSVGDKDQDIPRQVGEHGSRAKLLPIGYKSFNLPEQFQIIVEFLPGSLPSIPFRKA